MVHIANFCCQLDKFQPASASQVQFLAFPLSCLMAKTSQVSMGKQDLVAQPTIHLNS